MCERVGGQTEDRDSREEISTEFRTEGMRARNLAFAMKMKKEKKGILKVGTGEGFQ
jgi:hypothetical protein